MGHRHQFNTSQMFESDHDQNWNHMQTEQSFGHMGNMTILLMVYNHYLRICNVVFYLS